MSIDEIALIAVVQCNWLGSVFHCLPRSSAEEGAMKRGSQEGDSLTLCSVAENEAHFCSRLTSVLRHKLVRQAAKRWRGKKGEGAQPDLVRFWLSFFGTRAIYGCVYDIQCRYV